MSPTPYTDSIVAYVDILGFKELVHNNQVDTILRAMRIIRKRLRRIDEFPNPPLRHTMFSDTIVFSADLTDEGIEAVIHNVAYLTAELFNKGVFCRGAITTGPLYHRGVTIFGQALIDAYQMESQLAVYPRVVLSRDLVERFLNIKNARHHRDMHRGVNDYFRHDFDNQYHVDVLSPWMSRPPRKGLISNTVVRVIQKHVLKQIDADSSLANQRIQAKLFWLSEYLRYVNEVHGPIHFG